MMKKIALFHRKYPPVIPGAVILLILLAMIAWAPIQKVFEYGADEGINVMKSFLLLKGYPLYSAVWSDQPPVFTSLLACWFGIFGASLAAARILVLLFSGLLLFLLYLLIRRLDDDTAAAGACLFLFLSVNFARLSVSVMIGLPALALAIVSLYAACRAAERRSPILLISSGLLFAVSLQTKFFTAILLPLFLITIKNNRPWRENSRALLVWSGAFLLAYISVAAAFFHCAPAAFFSQLFAPHVRPLNIPPNDFSLIARMLTRDADLVLLALAAVLLAGWRKSLLPLAWLTCSLAVLAIHRPVWSHYYLLISLPLAWLAGSGFSRMVKKTGNKKLLFFSLAAVIAAVPLPSKILSLARSLQPPPVEKRNEIVEYISDRSGKEWVLCDAPIYCFYAGKLCPPEAAVISPKRRLTRELTEYILRKYKPELVILTWKEVCDPEAIRLLEKTYARSQEKQIRQVFSWTETGSFTPLATRIPRRISRFFRGNAWYKKITYKTCLPDNSPCTYTRCLDIRIFEGRKTNQ